MCGRFINLTKTNNLKKKLNIKSEIFSNLISYNISPSHNFFIIFKSQNINLSIEEARWGYSFFDKKNYLEKNIINSRLETIKEKILFKDSFLNRKCIVPLNGYYEWSTKESVKTPFFIHIPPSESMYLAGIWKYKDFKINNSKSFTILTKNSNDNLKIIHHRMPILLSFEEASEYLNDDNSSFLNNNFSSIIESEIDYYPVSNFVNNPINNSPICIKSV